MANKYQAESKAAQKNNHRLRSCETKKRYETKEAAFCKNQKVYHCGYCKGWHRSGAFTKLVMNLTPKEEREATKKRLSQ